MTTGIYSSNDESCMQVCKILHANGGSLYSKAGVEGRMPWVLALQQGHSACGFYLLGLLLWAHIVYVGPAILEAGSAAVIAASSTG